MATNNSFNPNPSLADYAAILSPTIFNIASSFAKPDKFNYISSNSLYSPNKNAGAALETLRQRKFDPTSVLYRNLQNANIAKYNARNLNTNSGANQAYDIMTAANRMSQDADTLSKTQELNNQYLGDYANALGQYGAQDAAQESQAKQAANQYNAQMNLYNMQSRAAKQNSMNAGLSQLSSFIQNKMRDQRETDVNKMQAAMWIQSLIEQGRVPGDRDSMSNLIQRYIVPQLGYNPFASQSEDLTIGIPRFNRSIKNPSYSTPLPTNLANTIVK